MRHAIVEEYIKVIDAVRKNCTRPLTNIFLDTDQIAKIFASKECLLCSFDNAVFVLVPYHDSYYDILYFTSDYMYLKKALKSFKSCYNKNFVVRASVIGKEPVAGEVSSIFAEVEFALSKKIGRVSYTGPNKNKTAVKFLESFGEDSENFATPCFADVSDAQAVLDMLLEEFDMCGENVPELDEIEENILKSQVVVVKINDTLAAVNYFTIKNNIRFCIYEYSRKKFREAGLMFSLNIFIEKHIKKNNIKVTRSYGWRDLTKKRLIRIYAALGENFDGIYIYNHIYNGSV